MKPRKTASIYVLLVGVLGLLIVGGIFAFQVVDEATKSQIPAAQVELVKPLDGKISEEVVENLSARKIFSREEISSLSIPTPTPTIIISPVTEASASSAAATLTETE